MIDFAVGYPTTNMLSTMTCQTCPDRLERHSVEIRQTLGGAVLTTLCHYLNGTFHGAALAGKKRLVLNDRMAPEA